jgi:hypothetical protein
VEFSHVIYDEVRWHLLRRNVRLCLSLCTFSEGHCIVCPSIYGFGLPLWHLETFGHYIVCSLTYAFWLPFGILKVLIITLFVLSYSSKRLIWVYKVRLYSICGDNNRKAVWSHKSSISPVSFHWRQIIDVSCICALGQIVPHVIYKLNEALRCHQRKLRADCIKGDLNAFKL